MDLQKSDVEYWSESSNTVADVSKYTFLSEKINRLSIFRVKENPTSIFVSNLFVSRLNEAELDGFNLKKVWSQSENSSEKTGLSKTQKRKVNLKSETLIICLNKASSSDISDKTLTSIEDEFDKNLLSASVNDTYLGSYEGYDLVENELIFFFSCPKANLLYNELFGLISKLESMGKVTTYEKLGSLYDDTIPAILID